MVARSFRLCGVRRRWATSAVKMCADRRQTCGSEPLLSESAGTAVTTRERWLPAGGPASCRHILRERGIPSMPSPYPCPTSARIVARELNRSKHRLGLRSMGSLVYSLLPRGERHTRHWKVPPGHRERRAGTIERPRRSRDCRSGRREDPLGPSRARGVPARARGVGWTRKKALDKHQAQP
jgi:hypothetical protein